MVNGTTKIIHNAFTTKDDFSHCPHGSLTDSYGLIVQSILGFVAFASLIIKRFFEPPAERRPWIIWFFDTSKQAIGALFIHFVNIFLSDLFIGDPCSWYITNYLLDSTIGLLIIFISLRVFHYLARAQSWTTVKIGDYGKPPSCHSWAHQCLIYLLIMLIEKILITILIQFRFWRNTFSYLVVPINNPKIEVALVVLVIPLCINILMFWVIDDMLMSHHMIYKKPHVKQSRKHNTKLQSSPNQTHFGNGLNTTDDNDYDSEDDHIHFLPNHPNKYSPNKNSNDFDSDLTTRLIIQQD